MKSLRMLLPALLLGAATAAGAAEPPALGVQGALVFPANDLTDGANLGLLLGGHGRWDFGNGHGLMGRADLTFYGSKNDNTIHSIDAGADYTYHVDRNRRGLYLLAGVSFINYDNSHAGTSSQSGLGVDVGLGYDLDRHLGLQLRYITHNIDHGTLSALGLGVTYTF